MCVKLDIVSNARVVLFLFYVPITPSNCGMIAIIGTFLHSIIIQVLLCRLRPSEQSNLICLSKVGLIASSYFYSKFILHAKNMRGGFFNINFSTCQKYEGGDNILYIYIFFSPAKRRVGWGHFFMFNFSTRGGWGLGRIDDHRWKHHC